MDIPVYSLPVEIWEEICGYACTDGGFTGRSLSLTSRFINESTRRMKLHSLAITRTRQLCYLAAKFLNNQESRDDKELEGIRHLFTILPHLFLEGDEGMDDSEYFPSSDSDSSFSTASDPEDDQSTDAADMSFESDYQVYRRYHRNLSSSPDFEAAVERRLAEIQIQEEPIPMQIELREREEEVLEALRSILSNCPNLRSLFLHCTQQEPRLESLSKYLVPLPSLVRLSINAIRKFDLTGFPDGPWFPSLQYLRVTAGRYRSYVYDTDSPVDIRASEFAAQNAPKLTHLRLLVCMLPTTEHDIQQFLSQFPEDLTKTIVEIPGNFVFHTGSIEHNGPLFRAIKDRFIFTQRDGVGSFSEEDEMRRYWEAELQGSDGSWSVYDERPLVPCACGRCAAMRHMRSERV